MASPPEAFVPPKQVRREAGNDARGLRASLHSDRTQWNFGEVLSQIGLAYPFAYLLVGRSLRAQAISCGAILAATWLAFALYPVPGPDFDYAALGIAPVPEPFTGFFAHWNKYTNLAYAFDRWFLNLFPQASPFLGNSVYGATLNFVPSIVTMLFGMMAGDLLRAPRSRKDKARVLVVAGAISLAAGLALGYTICPIIKALWTPSWVLASNAFVLWFLAAALWMADVLGWTRALFPLIVVGRNSLAMYLMLRVLKEPVRKTVEIHAGTLNIPHYWTFEFATVILILWRIYFWMYRRKPFLRL
jgi:predicted acyltransferase